MGHDRDITLKVGLESSDVKKDTQKLARSVQSVFSKYSEGAKALDKALSSTQNDVKKIASDIDKMVNQSKKDIEKLKDAKIGAGATKEATADLAKYQKELTTTLTKMKDLERKKEAMDKAGTKSIINPEWEKQNKVYEQTEKRFGKLLDSQERYVETQKALGKAVPDIEKMYGYQKLEQDILAASRAADKAEVELNKLNKTIEVPIAQTNEYKDVTTELKKLQTEYKVTQTKITDAQKAMTKTDLQSALENPTKNIKSALDAINKMEMSVDTKDFQKNADAVVKKIEAIRFEKQKLDSMQVPTDAFADLQTRWESADKEVDKYEQKIIHLGRVLSEMGQDSGENKQMQKLIAEQEVAQQEAEKLKAQMTELKASGQDVTLGINTDRSRQDAEALKYLEDQYKRVLLLQREKETADSAGVTGQNIKAEGEAAKDAGDKISDLADKKKKATDNNGKLADSASKTGKVMSTVGTGIKKTFGFIGKGLLASIARPFKKLRGDSKSTFGDMANNAKLSFMKILKYAFGIRSLYALFRRLRKYIKDAFGAMSESVPQVKQEIDTLKVNFTQLRNSLATAFQPIFSYVVPALNALCNALVSAMNVLANFFATLTGQKFIYKATKANDALADSIGGAGKAAKDANEDIAEYDKLIVINKNNDPNSGGGGSGKTNANAGAFEKVPSEVNKLAELIKQGWKESDFTKVGDYIGNSLKTALNKIPWAKLQKQASKLGSVFSTLINGFVEVPDLGNTIGNTIAEGLNTALTFINTAVHKLHWDSVGKFIADTLTSGLENFDWAKLSDTATTGLKGVATAVSTFFTEVQKKLPSILTKVNKAIQDFVKNFPVDEISNAISGLVNTVLQVINGLLPNLSDLVSKAGQLVMETIKKIDWKQVGTLFSNAFRELIQSATELLKNLDWEAVGKAIGEFLAGIDWAGLANDLWELLKTLFKSAFNLLVKGLPALFKEAPIATTLIGLFAGLKLTGLATKLSGLFSGVISTALGGIATSGLSATIYSVFGTKGTIALLIGTAIAGWKIGETFIAPAVEKGLTYISQKYGTLADLEEQNLVEERKQKIAEVGISINSVRQEMKKYGTDSKEATAVAKKGYEDIAKQIDTTYTAESKWRAEIDKLNTKRKLNLISEKERLEELQKIYDTTNRRSEKITSGIGLGLGKINEGINGTSEALQETTQDLGKTAQETAKHYTDMYKKSIIAPSKQATKSVTKVTKATKTLDKTTKQTTKDTTKSWKDANTAVEKSSSTAFDSIVKSSTAMKDNLSKNASVASTKTVTSLNNIKKNVNTSGLLTSFKSAFAQVSKAAETESNKAIDSLDAISKTKVIVQNLDFSGMEADIKSNEGAIKAALVNCLTIPDPTASIDAFSEALGALPGLSSESKEALIKDFQAMRVEADNVAVSDKKSIKNSFWDAAKSVADKYAEEGTSGFKGKLKSAFKTISDNAKTFATDKGGLASHYTEAGDTISSRFTKLMDGLPKVFENIKDNAKLYAMGDDGKGTNKGLSAWFYKAGNKIGERFTNLNEGMPKLFNNMKESAKENTMGSDGTGKTKGLAAWFSMSGDKVSERFTSLKSGLSTLFSGMKDSAQTNATGTNSISSYFTKAADNTKNGFTGIQNPITGVFTALKTSGENSARGINNKYADASDYINSNMRNAVIDSVTNVFNKLANKFGFSAVPIPGSTYPGAKRLAKGGVIPPNHEFLAVLGDQKQGINIETPLATMLEAFNKALEQNGGNSSNKEPIVLQLDGRTVAQVVWDENQKRYKQTGNYKFA